MSNRSRFMVSFTSKAHLVTSVWAKRWNPSSAGSEKVCWHRAKHLFRVTSVRFSSENYENFQLTAIHVSESWMIQPWDCVVWKFVCPPKSKLPHSAGMLAWAWTKFNWRKKKHFFVPPLMTIWARLRLFTQRDFRLLRAKKREKSHKTFSRFKVDEAIRWETQYSGIAARLVYMRSWHFRFHRVFVSFKCSNFSQTDTKNTKSKNKSQAFVKVKKSNQWQSYAKVKWFVL